MVMAMSAETHPAPALPLARPRFRRRPPAANTRAAGALTNLAAIGLGVTVLLTVSTQSLSALSSNGEALIFIGRLTGMVAAYSMLVLVLLVARLPVIERAAGQDQLVAWHRQIGPWPIYMVTAHGIFITLGYAAQAKTGVLHEFWTLLSTYPGVLAGTAGFLLLVTACVSSYRHVRKKMAYETWWTVHLYTYLALFLAFSHQTATGQPFVGHPAARAVWTAIWIGGAAAVLIYRVGLPLMRTLRHMPVVEAVHADAPGIATITVRGRALDRLPIAGGQFLQWRVLKPGLWWHAHPYSISSVPNHGRMKLTVKDLGDHSRAMTRLTPGTRLAIEGPYGRFTEDARGGDAVALVGAGVGIAPIKSLLEDTPPGVDIAVVVRGHTEDELVARDDIRALCAQRETVLHELAGSRSDVRLDRDRLVELIPSIAERDVYVCGPDGFITAVSTAAADAGVPPDRIHSERFDF
jgi:predicted ferric reductase